VQESGEHLSQPHEGPHDEHGVEAFEVGEDDELLQWGVVADVSFGRGMGIAPLFGGLAEEGYVEQVRLAGINGGGLSLGSSASAANTANAEHPPGSQSSIGFKTSNPTTNR
jgi:hypothetical protein